MKKLILLLVSIFFISLISIAQVIDEFRGVGRTGTYNETGLLKEWPAEGPEMLWSIEELPIGHSSLSAAYNMLYFTGRRDTIAVLTALDMKGQIKWQTDFGRAWNASYPNSRSTPTIENERLYVSSGYGDLACLNAINGELIWQVPAMDKFEGTYGKWGISESLLMLDNKIFFTTGGKKTTMVALDKTTGETFWMSETLKDNPSYASPILIENEENKIIVNVTESHVIGVNPSNGEIFWKFSFGAFAGLPYLANINCNMPVYCDEGKLFITSGYNHKNIMLQLTKDLKNVFFIRSGDVLDVHHGGIVKVGDYIYGSNWENNAMGRWVCLDWDSGEVMYETEWINKGSIIYNDGLLYCYEEKFGNLAIVKATPEEFNVVSSFKIPLGSRGPYWTHPVIKDGILYIRHGDALMAYNIKE
ncbi:MAG: PQQ-binding-like beta-propeller repeat protein [Bacteroidetes bacterium]|nr:PQQ-binding-like beta-propeller repeat protein [Bacteroidota bacterium]